MDIYYVYLLLDPRKFYSPFYVGKGKNARWKDHLSSKNIGKNLLKNSIIKKIRESGESISVLIWEKNLSEDCAFELEKELIKRFGRRNNETGILANLTDGGEGMSGYVYSDEQREYRRQKMMGAGSPTYGVGHADETKKKMSEAQKQRWIDGNGMHHSEEHKQHLRENNAGGKATSRPILQFDKDGNLLRKWNSMMSASKEIGRSKGNIGQVATKNKHRMAGNSFWRYEDDSEDVIDGKLVVPNGRREGIVKSIQQIGLNGEIVNVWESMKAAARGISGSQGGIWQAIANDRSYRGYNWKRL